MKILSNSQESGNLLEHGALAVGNFDGVHLGHQQLLKKVRELAPAGKSGVLTFDPHPAQVLCPEKSFFYLTNLEQKFNLFKQFNINIVINQIVSEEFLQISKEDFIKQILIKNLKIKNLIIGEDFAFGRNSLGNTQDLQKYRDFNTNIISDVLISNSKCSSTKIRKFLLNGDCEGAQKLLGRNFSICGRVVMGDRRGQIIGVKTANITPRAGLGLRLGVYATKVVIKSLGKSKLLPACTNIGIRPTFCRENKLIIETHIINFDQDIYDCDIEIYFYKFIRPEKKFNSSYELLEQIRKDIKLSQNILD